MFSFVKLFISICTTVSKLRSKTVSLFWEEKNKIKKILKFEMAFSSYEFHSLFESIPKKKKDISEWCSVKGPLI